jgi:hypothetical protein
VLFEHFDHLHTENSVIEKQASDVSVTEFNSKGLESAFQTAKQKQVNAILPSGARPFFDQRLQFNNRYPETYAIKTTATKITIKPLALRNDSDGRGLTFGIYRASCRNLPCIENSRTLRRTFSGNSASDSDISQKSGCEPR